MTKGYAVTRLVKNNGVCLFNCAFNLYNKFKYEQISGRWLVHPAIFFDSQDSAQEYAKREDRKDYTIIEFEHDETGVIYNLCSLQNFDGILGYRLGDPDGDWQYGPAWNIYTLYNFGIHGRNYTLGALDELTTQFQSAMQLDTIIKANESVQNNFGMRPNIGTYL